MSKMKSSRKRMNHVFNEMVVKAGRDIDTAELQFINGGVSATFFCAQQAIHAAYAINNHDRLVEEIAELKGAIEAAMRIKELWLPMGASSDDPPENYHEIEALHKMANNFDKALAKLNQEGEE